VDKYTMINDIDIAIKTKRNERKTTIYDKLMTHTSKCKAMHIFKQTTHSHIYQR